MCRFRNLSIRTKILFLAAVSVGVALLLSCAGFTFNEIRTMRGFKLDELRTQGRMLAFNSSGVLSFLDASAAERLLASLQSQPTVEKACLYNSDGKPLAFYPAKTPPEDVPPAVFREEHRFTDHGKLEIFSPVINHGETIGCLYLCADLHDLRQQLWDYGKIVAVVVLCSMFASVLLAMRLRNAIAGPISQLADTARKITSAGDYTLRVEQKSQDELGMLCAEFNTMLNQVERSDTALKKAHDELEDRVEERTAELRQEIAEREKVQVALVTAKEAAEAANVAKSRFLANMSHEIRTPLNAILGFTELLRLNADEGNEAERQDFLGTIYASGQHLLSLINDILDLSKIEADRLEVECIPCVPQQIVSEVMSVLRVRALEKHLTLESRWLGAEPRMIRTDPARFRQLLMNLVSNALKFTKTGGVQILTELLADAPEPMLKVQVIDTGIGIPAEKLRTIFDPFVQADSSVTREFGGTGLGLTISRRIAEALGGSIHVESIVGRGSNFTLMIPAGPLDDIPFIESTSADALKSPASVHDTMQSCLQGTKILLVEDGEVNRKLIRLILQRAGADVSLAENGRQGLDLAKRQPFNLILMDMQMPVMDGYSAAMRLRQAGNTTPIVALTAHAMKGDEEKCKQAGCDTYLPKPIDAPTLLATVAQWCSKTHLQETPAPNAVGVHPEIGSPS
ncbi:MAG: response regulator [Pirellulales bacterium]|nr:response regulator [Pirellulales bacterium]